MLVEFSYLVSYIVILLLLALILVLSSFILIGRDSDLEKVSAYECGFHPFEDTRSRFEVRFYLVAILFIIFDLEVSFLFPIIPLNISLPTYLILLVFLFVLTLGFVYEWVSGALDWE